MKLFKVDTTKFDDQSPSRYKKETQDHWSGNPCGSNYSAYDDFTKEYFDEIENHRYATHPWIKADIDSFDLSNNKTLEIGYGMGTDHLQMARKGGIMHGIDLTRRNYEVTSKRFNYYDAKSELLTGDAENLPYGDNSFDFVYSFGVIHHSPNTEKIISEIHRVLKPGGKCYITVYHKNSIFFWWTTYIRNYLWRGGYKQRSIQEQLSLIEFPNNNSNIVTRLYKKSEFKSLFASFSKIKSSVKHLLPADIAGFDALWPKPNSPNRLFSWLGRWFGWYVVITAEK